MAAVRVPHPTEALWWQFTDRRDDAVREQLALAYLPLVRTQARHLASRIPPSVRTEDLEGYGMIGLLEAIDRFDPNRGIPFEVFARLRIRGAMYDYLRTLDLLPRVARRKVHRVQAQSRALMRVLGRTPTHDELAQAMGVERQTVGRTLATAQDAVPVSLEEHAADRLPPALARDAGGDVISLVEREALDAELWRAIEALSPRHKVVIGLYYCEGLTLYEIGRVLSVTESRASQMRREALEGLRTHLALRAWLDASPAVSTGTGEFAGARTEARASGSEH